MRRLTKIDFISKSILKHGDIYDYSKLIYKNRRSIVIITCKKHGDFEQEAGSHMYGKGCSKCANNVNSSTEEFIEKVRKIHGTSYGYGKVEYVNSRKKIIIVCREHGDFLQTPTSHSNGNGCDKCFRIRLADSQRKTEENFINQAKLIHPDLYDYSKIKYYRTSDKLEIICKKHGSFWQTGNNHLSGHGCPKCISIISKPEIEVQNFVNSIGYSTDLNNRKILKGKELDIYIPSLKKAIEFNGEYWHYSERYFKGGKHAIKSNLCREKGIKLLYVRENLWNKDKERMKKVIIKFLKNGK